MKVAVLGGGISGLTTAYYLAKNGFEATVFEKQKNFGGLASGFKAKNWEWSLERTYHHIFANDNDILNFSKEIGFDKFFFKKPQTSSIYDNNSKVNKKFEIFPLDSPVDLLKFPYLNLIDKLRAGAILGFLKLSPFLPLFEKTTSIDFLEKTMGKDAYEMLFGQLFRKKFGDYAGNILASFFWARIKKRTKSLGYPEGGFQNFIDYLVDKLKKMNVKLISDFEIKEILKIQNSKFKIQNYIYDIVISTLPTPILTKISTKIFPAYFLQNLRKIKYLNALTVIIESKKPLLKDVYWLNISTSKIPIMAIVEHTNFIDKKYYGNNHLIYLGWYLKDNDKLMLMDNENLTKFIASYLKLINNTFHVSRSKLYIFRSSFAQPIFDKEFIKVKPDFFTPAKNFYIANLDMTYPYDRGTNYAVKLGKEVAEIISSNILNM